MTKKVIIIDDSVTSLNILKTAFAKAGWEVWGIQESIGAIELIYDIAPDIIIADAIMPKMGGFSLLREIRKNDDLSLIPVIIYSVLDKKNAKFYIKEQCAEYFLKKDDNIDELLDLAYKAVCNTPLSDDYKLNILKASLAFHPVETEPVETEIEHEVIKKEFIESEFEEKIKQNYDFSLSDEIIIKNINQILFEALDYNLCLVYLESNKTVYFDIKDFILSPIFQNSILNKYDCKNSVLYKKYAPNLKTIVNEDEFFSNINFNFEYNKKNIASISFYSKEKSKWNNSNEVVEAIKTILNNFFKARFLNKKSDSNKKDSIKERYYTDNIEKINPLNKNNLYFAIIEITNYQELSRVLSEEELDMLNLKISQAIINYLDKDEQVYKNEVDEYNVIIYAQSEKQAYQKLNFIKNLINGINSNSLNPETAIGAVVCNCEGNINFYEAQKTARLALESTTKEETMVIKNAE